MTFLVQMRQVNKWESVRNEEMFNLNLGSGSGPWVGIFFFPASHQPHLLIPSSKIIAQDKAKNPEIRFTSQQIVLYCLNLRTHNPGLREVDLENSPKKGTDKVNMLQQRRNINKNASHIVQTGLTYASQHLKR